jgi:multiple sugar transport system ATP-binding protein
MDLAVSGLYKRFGTVAALQGVSLDVQSGEFFAILGPSGAGKTTLLRIVAGIDAPDAGRVLLDGRNVAETPVRARNTAMVFQTFALYPHMTTFENLAYPLREARVAREEIRRRVSEIAEMLRLSHTLGRKPGTLSGGEQQRCAIGRALIRRPKLLLLDEPLTNLDAKLRHDTRAEFKRLHRELGSTTIVYATPDQLEALSMGSRVAVLRQGRIVQVGGPEELYEAPGDEFVASLVGDPPINLLPGTLRTDGNDARIDLPFMGLDARPWRRALAGFATGMQVKVGLRPQAIWPAGDGREGPGFGARVFLTEPLGDVTILNIVAHGDARLRMVLPQERAWRIAVDDTLDCTIDPDQISLFAAETGTAIRRGGAETAA